VLANRTAGAVTCQVDLLAGVGSELTLAAQEVVPLFLDGKANLAFTSGRESKRYTLDANSAYYFGQARDGRLDLQQIGLGGDTSTDQGRKLPGSAVTAPTAVIPVTIYVDEEEPAKRAIWERRLRQRVEAASMILDKYCHVRLSVVGVGEWQSDNATTDFFDSLSEFEREVKPFPGRLAIGFTSQYQVVRGRVHLAGTRGPLHTHILIREWSQHVSEPERLELLVHELGHFLGASHSPEGDSVMRPVLGNRQAVRAGFQVRFDPVNTLVIGMVGEEIRRRKIQRLSDLSEGSKLRLRQIYEALQPTLPDDPAAKHFLQLLGATTTGGPAAGGNAVAVATPVVLGTQQVVAQIVRTAQANRALPPASAVAAGQPSRHDGDKLTELYVRKAAGIARFLPDDIGPTAFVLGLGIGLDDSDVLRRHDAFGNLVRAVESDDERQLRTRFLGQPTIRGRRDLAQHFVLSSYLTALSGTKVALAAGLAKELVDAKGASGFSFADLATDRAGILFAGGVLTRRFPLRTLAEEFAVADYTPEVDGLAEGLSLAELVSQFGTQEDAGFREQLRVIDQRLLALPAYSTWSRRLESSQGSGSPQP
jgi:hypothetical protein